MVSEQSLAIYTAEDLLMHEDVRIFPRCADAVLNLTLTQTTPNPNLSPSSALAVPLPEVAVIFLTEMTKMQVATNAPGRCRVARLWNYEYGYRSCGQFVCRRARKKFIHCVENINLCRVRGGKSLITSLELGEKKF